MIGQALKTIRGVYGFKAKEVAEQLGISAGYLSDIEAEKKTPSLEILKLFGDLYNIRMSTIMYLSEEIPADSENGESRNKVRDKVLRTIRILGKNSIVDNEDA